MPIFEYPHSRKDDVVEDYHGTPIADPYRWLEDPFVDEVQAWITEQNTLTADYMSEISARQVIQQRLQRYYDGARPEAPRRVEERVFYLRNDGLQDQAVLYWREGADGDEHVLLDPNTLSEDGTIALTNWSVSRDGKRLAYALSSSGSDWQTAHVRDVDSATDYDEVLEWLKFTSMSWLPDSSGFYYSRYPAQGSQDDQSVSLDLAVYLHTVGTPQSDDPHIYALPDEPELLMSPVITEDGEYLLIYVFGGASNRNRIHYRPLHSDGDFIRLLDDNDARYLALTTIDRTMIIHTDYDAPRGQVIAIDLDQPEREHWRTLIPESDGSISSAHIAGDYIVIAYLRNAIYAIKVFDQDGYFQHELALPGIGSVVEIETSSKHNTVFVNFQSHLHPPTVLAYDVITAEQQIFSSSNLDFDRDVYTTTQVWYESKDGTRVSMFLTHRKDHRKDITLDGDNPVLLYGYGGFSISVLPLFAPHVLNWLDMGGIYAMANLRGGDEYGDDWHQAGMLGNKQNVFDDFIAAAEWLIAEGYTRSEKLAVMGRSNGGLLVAACMVQRPALFGAVICVVPVTDMLRFHRFTAGRFWTFEYGNAEDNPEHFAFLHAYSPLHNVKAGTTYPPILITTADKDDRVVPLHAMKFTAALQTADTGNHPILLRLDTKSGHGAGKPTSKWIEEWADIYAFLHRSLGLED